MPAAYPIKAQPIELSTDKSWLLGHLAGDGCITTPDTSTQKKWSFFRVDVAAGLDRDVADLCVRLFGEVYGATSKVVELQPGKGKRKHVNYVVTCYWIEVVEDVISYAPFGVYRWRVPEQVIAGTPAVRGAWLSGYFDADGGTYQNERSARQVHVTSVCREGLVQVSALLTGLGIRHSFMVLNKANDKGWKESLRVTIHYKEDLCRFRDLVGFRSPTKKAKLDLMISTYERDVVRSEDVEKHADEIRSRRLAGETHAAIAISLGLERETVAHHCYRAGVEPEGREGTADGGARSVALGPIERLLPRILELRAHGLKDAAIANALGLENATQVAMAVLRARRKGNATPLVTKLEELLPKILALRGEGKTFREIGESFGHGEGQKAALWAINYVARAKRRGLLGQDGAILPGAFDVHRTGRGVSVSKVCVVEKVAAARDSSVLWLVTDKGDSDARALVDGTSVGKAPHYSRQKPGAKLFTRNGQNLVFMTEDKLAVWVTFRPAPGKAVRPDGMDAWECTMFRNEGPWRSSDLVREAVELSVALWGPVPKDGFITFVKSESVGRGNINHIPGYCYRRAGWKHRGQSSDGKPRFVAPIQKSCRPFNAWGWKAGRGGKLRLAIEASTFRVEGPSA